MLADRLNKIMNKPKAINSKKLVAFVLPINRKAVAYHDKENDMWQLF